MSYITFRDGLVDQVDPPVGVELERYPIEKVGCGYRDEPVDEDRMVL